MAVFTTRPIALSHLSLKAFSLWGSPVVVPRPCTGARSATSYRMCTTGHSLGYKSHGGARSTGHLWYSQRGDPLTEMVQGAYAVHLQLRVRKFFSARSTL